MRKTVPEVTVIDHFTWYKEQCEKLLTERIAGVEYAVVRPGLVYSLGSRYLGGLILAIDRLGSIGIPFIGKGEKIVPLIHVRDIAHGCISGEHRARCIRSGIQYYQRSSTKLDGFFQIHGRCTQQKIENPFITAFSVRGPSPVSRCFVRDIQCPARPERLLQYVSTDVLFDNSKAQRLLNWKPECTMIQGIEEMIREYRER